MPDNAAMLSADLMVGTIGLLSRRAPAIVAAAGKQLGTVHLLVHFGDGSHAMLANTQGMLTAAHAIPDTSCQVEAYFDDRSLALLFDGAGWPVEQAMEGSLDVRGERLDVLATWRTFRLLAQRASGLRAVQQIWLAYRNGAAKGWSPSEPGVTPDRRTTRTHWDIAHWPALDWLDQRHPAGEDLIARGEPVLAPARSLWTGRQAGSWQAAPPVFDNDLDATMAQFKQLVVDEILRLVPNKRPRRDLYDLMRDYVQRAGKGLRPTLVISTCLAFGGRIEDGVRAAAALEMFHNGFLVHDDIADESTHRRGLPTLHEAHGIGLAINAGDAMHLFAVDMTLSNLSTLGLSRTLALIHEILHMCRETVEGQAIELGWIRRNVVPRRDGDYSMMSTKKTGWYTCISPCRIGAVAAGVTAPVDLDRFNEAFRLIGIAFQIQDDVLNLVGDTALYGKEALGDLLEGKRTVMMIHLFRSSPPEVVARMTAINAMSRIDKPFAVAEEMLAAMHKVGSVDYGIAHALALAGKGVHRFERDLAFVPDNPSKAVLRQVANYVVTRAL
ncbi:polyprenyl synthetase family protein [Sphingomonas sp. LB2R24]